MPDYFQDHMPGNICFGCGSLNADGLQIKSHWEGDEGVCVWMPEPKYRGWENVLNGGVLATLIDCHCMGTALADAYRTEARPMASEPIYRYATATISVRYLKPTPSNRPIMLRARVIQVSGRKTRLRCQVTVDGQATAEAEVMGVRVLEGAPAEGSAFR
jgi:acyl-coenzyme A thioesterase PaaI-like protein